MSLSPRVAYNSRHNSSNSMMKLSVSRKPLIVRNEKSEGALQEPTKAPKRPGVFKMISEAQKKFCKDSTTLQALASERSEKPMKTIPHTKQREENETKQSEVIQTLQNVTEVASSSMINELIKDENEENQKITNKEENENSGKLGENISGIEETELEISETENKVENVENSVESEKKINNISENEKNITIETVTDVKNEILSTNIDEIENEKNVKEKESENSANCKLNRKDTNFEVHETANNATENNFKPAQENVETHEENENVSKEIEVKNLEKCHDAIENLPMKTKIEVESNNLTMTETGNRPENQRTKDEISERNDKNQISPNSPTSLERFSNVKNFPSNETSNSECDKKIISSNVELFQRNTEVQEKIENRSFEHPSIFTSQSKNYEYYSSSKNIHSCVDLQAFYNRKFNLLLPEKIFHISLENISIPERIAFSMNQIRQICARKRNSQILQNACLGSDENIVTIVKSVGSTCGLCTFFDNSSKISSSSLTIGNESNGESFIFLEDKSTNFPSVTKTAFCVEFDENCGESLDGGNYEKMTNEDGMKHFNFTFENDSDDEIYVEQVYPKWDNCTNTETCFHTDDDFQDENVWKIRNGFDFAERNKSKTGTRFGNDYYCDNLGKKITVEKIPESEAEQRVFPSQHAKDIEIANKKPEKNRRETKMEEIRDLLEEVLDQVEIQLSSKNYCSSCRTHQTSLPLKNSYPKPRHHKKYQRKSRNEKNKTHQNPVFFSRETLLPFIYGFLFTVVFVCLLLSFDCNEST